MYLNYMQNSNHLFRKKLSAFFNSPKSKILIRHIGNISRQIVPIAHKYCKTKRKFTYP